MEENRNIEMRAETPSFVYRDGMTANIEYVEWLSEVKARFRRSQIKASVRVNTSMLEFYWSVGRDLVALRAEERWGAGVVKQFALDMRQTFPDETGFSHTNVKYMKQWYSFYYDRFTKSHQNGGQMPTAGTYLTRTLANRLEPEFGTGFGVRQLERARQFYRTYPIASTVRSQLNWSQYKLLISISDPDKREYYELESVNNAWTARETERQINSMLYERLLTLPEDNKTILASEYQLYLPTQEQLIQEINEVKRLAQNKGE